MKEFYTDRKPGFRVLCGSTIPLNKSRYSDAGLSRTKIVAKKASRKFGFVADNEKKDDKEIS